MEFEVRIRVRGRVATQRLVLHSRCDHCGAVFRAFKVTAADLTQFLDMLSAYGVQ